MPTKSTKNSKPVRAAKEPTSVVSANGLSTLSPTELHNLISQRAYAIYLQRGAAWGSQLDDWLSAEQEITAQTPDQILEAAPAPITTNTRKATARAATVKTPVKRNTTTRARKKPAPEI